MPSVDEDLCLQGAPGTANESIDGHSLPNMQSGTI